MKASLWLKITFLVLVTLVASTTTARVKTLWAALFYKANADTISTTVDVVPPDCGNGVLNAGEVCDDGAQNGNYGYCASDCLTIGSRCGDSVIQVSVEQCDDGNLLNNDGCNSICQLEGGGSGVPINTNTSSVYFSGKAYPFGQITVLKDSVPAISGIADANGSFQLLLSNITPGNYSFIVVGQDVFGLHSRSDNYVVGLYPNQTLNILNIFLPPTISSSKEQVMQGQIMDFYGSTLPDSQVILTTRHVTSTFLRVDSVQSNTRGEWYVSYRTITSTSGEHLGQANVIYPYASNTYSSVVSFIIGSTTTEGYCWRIADLNCDGYVNLIDYSIAAYWWKRPLTEEGRIKVDEHLYPDNKIDLRDFSVMAYYWTG